jgi:uncharacterized membrane protein
MNNLFKEVLMPFVYSSVVIPSILVKVIATIMFVVFGAALIISYVRRIDDPSYYFSDRDLSILVVGLLLSVLCLFIQWLVIARVAIGLLILFGVTVIALLRIGPDRLTIEDNIIRRFSHRRRRFYKTR